MNFNYRLGARQLHNLGYFGSSFQIVFIQSKEEKKKQHFSLGQSKKIINLRTASFKTLLLLDSSYQKEVFKYIPKDFTISTKDSSSQFNMLMLAQASQTISQELKLNSDLRQYYLDISDKENVLDKFSKLFQGEEATFSDESLPTSFKITRLLKIFQCPNFMKPENMRTNDNEKSFGLNTWDTSRYDEDSNKVIIDQKNFNNFLINRFKNTFIISTRTNEYTCQLYAVYSSEVIREKLQENPELERFNFDYEDEFKEFDPICKLFNFEEVNITRNNMNNLKEIIDLLKISCLQDQINDFIENYDEVSEKVFDQQESIDPIEEVFSWLYNINKLSVETVKNSILNSKFIKKEDDVRELAAFFIHVIKSDFLVQKKLVELLVQLNGEADKSNNLNLLLPLVINQLLFIIGISKPVCSFVYLLYKRELISKNDLISCLRQCFNNKNDYKKYFEIQMFNNRSFNRNDSFIRYRQNVIFWFWSELIENKIVTNFTQYFNRESESFWNNFYPNKLEEYKKMREKFEPEDEITLALRNDDVDKLQSILSKLPETKKKLLVPFNIFEEYVANGQTNYINYSSAYGSLKCFKYLFLNHHKISGETFRYAIYGGNSEIIQIVDKNIDKMEVTLNMLIPAVMKHHNDIFDWLFEQKLVNEDASKDNVVFDSLVNLSIICGNGHVLNQIIDNGYDCSKLFGNIINLASSNGFYTIAKFIFNINFDENNNNNQEKSIIFVELDNNNAFSSVAGSQNKNDKLASRIQFVPSVSFGNPSIFKLFENKMNSTDLQCSFYFAVLRNHLGIIKYFFENTIKNNFSLTDDIITDSLKKSMEFKDNVVFNFLIDRLNPTDPLAFKGLGMLKTLLSLACKTNKLEIAKKITEMILSKNPNEDFFNSFWTSAIKNCAEMLKYFVEKRVFINYDEFPLINNYDMFSEINEETLELFYNNLPPKYQRIFVYNVLNSAIKFKNIHLIDFCLKNGAPKYGALNQAALTNNINVVDVVLKYDSSPGFINTNMSNGTPLSIAANNSCTAIVKRLLSIPGINPSLYTNAGVTPLIISFQKNNVEMAKDILDFYGDNIKSQVWQLNKSLPIFLRDLKLEWIANQIKEQNNKLNKNVNNALSHVKFNKESSDVYEYKKWLPIIIRILNVENVDYNSFSENFTLLTFACSFNEIEIVDILLNSNKVDPNLYGSGNGDTALIKAIQNKNIEIAKRLIEYQQTDINLCNFRGESPLMIAVKMKLTEIIDLLVQNEKFDPVKSHLDEVFYNSDPSILPHLISAKWLDVNYFELATLNNKNQNKFFVQEVCGNKQKIEKLALSNILISISDIEIFDMIIKHPSFDIEKSFGKTLLFHFTEVGKEEYFNKIFSFYNNDVNIIDESGISLLVSATNKRNKNLVNRILNDENFDCNKSQIIYAFSFSTRFVQICELLFKYIQNHVNQIEFTNLLPNGHSIYESFLKYKNVDPQIANDIQLRINNDQNNNQINNSNQNNGSENKSQITKYINFFIENGVDLNIPNRDGFYPLEIAISRNNTSSFEIAEILINSNKIDLNIKIPSKTFYQSCYDNTLYQSYLNLALPNKNVLNLLLKQKTIDVNITDNLGETPLMKACRQYDIDSVHLLFKSSDLDYRHKNNKGEDALMLVNSSLDNPEIIEPPQDKDKYLEKLLSLFDKRKKNRPKGFSFSFRGINADNVDANSEKQSEVKTDVLLGKTSGNKNASKSNEENKNASKSKATNVLSIGKLELNKSPIASNFNNSQSKSIHANKNIETYQKQIEVNGDKHIKKVTSSNDSQFNFSLPKFEKSSSEFKSDKDQSKLSFSFSFNKKKDETEQKQIEANGVQKDSHSNDNKTSVNQAASKTTEVNKNAAETKTTNFYSFGKPESNKSQLESNSEKGQKKFSFGGFNFAKKNVEADKKHPETGEPKTPPSPDNKNYDT